MYVWMARMPFKREPYFILKRRSVRKFLRKRLLFKKQKVDSTGYYGIVDPFPDLISKLRRFRGGGIRSADCYVVNAKEATTTRGKLR